MSYVDVLNLAEYGTSRIFMNIKPGQRVYYRDRNGVKKYGKANALLLFPDHVVLNVGNFGVVVDIDNFIKVTPVKEWANG